MKLLARGIFAENEMNEAAGMVLNCCGEKKLFLLKGNLGAGKTTLCKELVQQLGYTGRVSSPTFGLVNQYLLPDESLINHLDLYRIKSEEELLEAGIYETLFSGEICLIEWPELLEQHIPETYVLIEIESRDGKREVSVFESEGV